MSVIKFFANGKITNYNKFFGHYKKYFNLVQYGVDIIIANVEIVDDYFTHKNNDNIEYFMWNVYLPFLVIKWMSSKPEINCFSKHTNNNTTCIEECDYKKLTLFDENEKYQLFGNPNIYLKPTELGESIRNFNDAVLILFKTKNFKKCVQIISFYIISEFKKSFEKAGYGNVAAALFVGGLGRYIHLDIECEFKQIREKIY